MDESTFWQNIESSRSESTPGLSDQAEILQRKLAALPAGDIVEFDRIFQRLFSQAYTWDLWAAGYIIGGGCGDDGFMDFRAGLIGLGKVGYYNALKDAQSLANQPSRSVDFSQEDLLYVARNAFEAVTGGTEMPDNHVDDPSEPLGEPWDEKRVGEKFPKLAKHFGFGG